MSAPLAVCPVVCMGVCICACVHLCVCVCLCVLVVHVGLAQHSRHAGDVPRGAGRDRAAQQRGPPNAAAEPATPSPFALLKYFVSKTLSVVYVCVFMGVRRVFGRVFGRASSYVCLCVCVNVCVFM